MLASAASGRARFWIKLGLRDRERNTPGQFSGGQQQRVAIARALINQPSLLLADEPTGNLDTRNSHEIMQTLSSLNREQGVTIIVVTHESDIAAFADRVLTMRDGQIISDLRTRSATKNLRPRPRPRSANCAESGDRRPTSKNPGASWPFVWMVMTAAAEAIWRNMMRSALTMLGVFIGVAALIVMVSVGQGANEAVRKEIARLGTNLVVILPGRDYEWRCPRGFWKCFDADRHRCPGDPARGTFRRRGELSDSSVGKSAICEPELDDEHSGCERQLPADDQLADRRRASDHGGRREKRRAGRRAGRDRSAAAFQRPSRIRSARWFR